MSAPFIRFDKVSVVFDGKVRALQDVSLSLNKGDILGLVG